MRKFNIPVIIVILILLNWMCSRLENKDTETEPEPRLPTYEKIVEEKQLSDPFQEMTWGNIVFNVPDSMKLNESKGIHLILSETQSVENFEKQIQEQGRLQKRRIQISNIMVAELKGGGFQIDPITEPLQIINKWGINEWRWEITALKPGSRKLYLTMTAIITIDGQERPHTIKSLQETIEIHVTWQQRVSAFVGKNWQWLWTSILIPLIGWIWERIRKKSNEK